MSRALLGLLLLATACDKVLGLKEDKDRKFDATSPDGEIDAPPDAPPSCATHPLTSSFTTTMEFDQRWDRATDANGAAVAVVNQQLEVTVGVPTGYANAASNQQYSFRGGDARVRLVDAPIVANVETAFEVGTSSSNSYFFLIDRNGTMGELAMTARMGNVDQGSKKIDYDPTVHRFLRIYHNEARDVVIFSTSNDGLNWIDRYEFGVLFNLGGVLFKLGIGSYSPGVALAEKAHFDDFDFCRQ